MTGLSTSTIYRWMSEGTFPKQIQLGSRSVVWLESDVTKWMEDQIKIIGVFSQDLSFKENVTARGVSGIGIYAKGTLEAVYTGGNLSIGQLTQMTSGDGSTAAMNNQMWSYWGSNTVPSLQA